MKYLINAKGGYYINGVKQNNYSLDDVNDCYFYIMDRVYGTYTYKYGKQGRVIYDPDRMNIASFFHVWIRGFASQLRKKQHRRHLAGKGKVLFLEDITEKNVLPTESIDYDSCLDLDENTEVNACLNLEKILKELNIEDSSDFELFSMFLENRISEELHTKLCEAFCAFNIHRNRKVKF